MRSFPERSPEGKRQDEPDDLALIQFLRQHRPSVPTAPPDLEDRIMAALDQPFVETPSREFPSRDLHRNTIPVHPVGAKHSVNICAESIDLLPNASPLLRVGKVERLSAEKVRTGTTRSERSRRLRWMLPTALAASLVAGLYSSQLLRTSPASDSEVAKLEAFIASTWSTPTENPHSEVEFASQVLMELPEETEP